MAKTRTNKPRHADAPVVRERREYPPDWQIFALAVVGMVLTAYLTIATWSSTGIAFCAEGSSCDIIQGSRWSTLLGIPIALWGFATYALLAGFSLRTGSRLRRWKRLWRISLIGLAISVYLTVIGWIMLDAFCLWCLLSLAVMTAIFVLVCLRTPPSAPGMPWRNWAVSTGLVALALVAGVHAASSGLLEPREDPRLTALAQHLDRTGAKYYGAFWCPACREQSRLFAGSAKYLPYVECSPDGRNGAVALDCVLPEIEGFPTWQIRGRYYQQRFEPEELARMSGFRWNRSGNERDGDSN